MTTPTTLPTRQSANRLKPVLIPDVLGIDGQFAPLVTIWAECVNELKVYSKVLGKGANATTREAFEALPKILLNGADHPDKTAWETLVATHKREDGFSLIPTCQIAAIQSISEREKLTLVQSQALAKTAEMIGYAIVPDTRITGRVYSWSDNVILFRSDSITSIDKDSIYPAAAYLLELGMLIAGADGMVDQVELDQIENFLKAQFRLSSDDKSRLKAYGILLTQTPPSISELSKQLRETLTLDQRGLLGRYLISVAGANGVIDQKELFTLKRLYKYLDLEIRSLEVLLNEFQASNSQPVIIRQGKRGIRTGEPIPAKEFKPLIIAFDEDAVLRIKADTLEISRILSMALSNSEHDPGTDKTSDFEESLISNSQQLAIKLLFNEEQLLGLDGNYYNALAVLISKNSWQKNEMTALAKMNNIMPTGMVDAINTWSEVSLGDILIEDDDEDEYTINLSLLETK